MRLATAATERPEWVAARLGSAARHDDRALVALNTALFQDGALVEIADGVEVVEPIHVLHVVVPSDRPSTVHTRALILAGRVGRWDG